MQSGSCGGAARGRALVVLILPKAKLRAWKEHTVNRFQISDGVFIYLSRQAAVAEVAGSASGQLTNRRGERDLGAQGRPSVRRAGQQEAPIEGFDAVGETP